MCGASAKGRKESPSNSQHDGSRKKSGKEEFAVLRSRKSTTATLGRVIRLFITGGGGGDDHFQCSDEQQQQMAPLNWWMTQRGLMGGRTSFWWLPLCPTAVR